MFKAARAGSCAFTLSRLFAPVVLRHGNKAGCTDKEPSAPPVSWRALNLMTPHSGSCIGQRVWPEGQPACQNGDPLNVSAAPYAESKAPSASVPPLNVVMLVCTYLLHAPWSLVFSQLLPLPRQQRLATTRIAHCMALYMQAVGTQGDIQVAVLQ